jgi:hypothetical protein
MTKEEKKKILDACDRLLEELSKVKKSKREIKAGPYEFIGQVTWRAGDLRRTIERGTLS